MIFKGKPSCTVYTLSRKKSISISPISPFKLKLKLHKNIRDLVKPKTKTLQHFEKNYE